jgi:hypothetical protein
MIKLLRIDNKTSRVFSVKDKTVQHREVPGVSVIYRVLRNYDKSLLENPFSYVYNIGIGVSRSREKLSRETESRLKDLQLRCDLIDTIWEYHWCFIENTKIERHNENTKILSYEANKAYEELCDKQFEVRNENARSHFNSMQDAIMRSDNPLEVFNKGMSSYMVIA